MYDTLPQYCEYLDVHSTVSHFMSKRILNHYILNNYIFFSPHHSHKNSNFFLNIPAFLGWNSPCLFSAPLRMPPHPPSSSISENLHTQRCPKFLAQALLSLPQHQSVDQEKSKSLINSDKVLDNTALLENVISCLSHYTNEPLSHIIVIVSENPIHISAKPIPQSTDYLSTSKPVGRADKQILTKVSDKLQQKSQTSTLWVFQSTPVL